VSDKSKPYLFQLLEKWETATTVKNDTSESHRDIVNPSYTTQKQAEGKDKGVKPTGMIVANKPAVSLPEVPPKRMPEISKPAPAQIHMPHKEVSSRQKTEEAMESLRSQKKKSERIPTDDREMTEGNDMFASESLGLDITIDSAAINQFDYNESVDRGD